MKFGGCGVDKVFVFLYGKQHLIEQNFLVPFSVQMSLRDSCRGNPYDRQFIRPFLGQASVMCHWLALLIRVPGQKIWMLTTKLQWRFAQHEFAEGRTQTG